MNYPDFVYQLASVKETGIVYSAGKYLPLTKWQKGKDASSKCTKLAETPEGILRLDLRIQISSRDYRRAWKVMAS